VRTLFFLVILAIILVGALLLGLSDTIISIPNASVPVKEVTSSISKASNSSASATITITMYTLPDG